MCVKMAILFILSLTAGVTVSYVRPSASFLNHVAYNEWRLGPMITTGFDEIASTFHVNADQISFNLVGL